MANLTIKAELGSCLLHRKGRLTVDNCFLECADHPLDHLSCPIISTADDSSCPISKAQNEVSVIETRIEGGFGCVRTSGSLKLQQVNMKPPSLILFIFESYFFTHQFYIIHSPEFISIQIVDSTLPLNDLISICTRTFSSLCRALTLMKNETCVIGKLLSTYTCFQQESRV